MLISVIIPLYNKARSIASALHSVLDQTFRDYEIVVVNDGSTDHSVAEVRKVQDPRIRLFHQQNAGVSAARNRGIEEAKGELVAFLDADDEWNPEYLETQCLLSQQYPDCDVFACNYVFRDTAGKITPTLLQKLPFSGENGILANYFEVACCSHPPLWTSAVVVRKAALQSIEGFPVGVKSGEDLLTWARLAVNGSIAYSKRPLAVFNVDGYDMGDKPKRIPAENDVVGKELNVLLAKYPSKDLRHYNALWHKMRSSVYMRLNMRKSSIKEATIALKYAPLNYKLYIYILLNLLPSKLRPF